MPPKLRKEVREDAEELESVASPGSGFSESTHSTSSAGLILSAEQLQQVLEASTRSMMALMERRLPPAVSMSVAADASASVSRSRIDIPKWTEGDGPSEFLGKYEQALLHNGVGREQWGRLLRVYLTGSAQAAYQLISVDCLDDYDHVKKEFLESLGDTPEGADKRWVTLNRQEGENPRALFRRIHNTGYRRMDGLTSKEERCNKMIMSKFLTLLSPDCYSSVICKRPKNGQEAARFAQEFEDDVLFAQSLPSRSGSYYNSHYNREGPKVFNPPSGLRGNPSGSANSDDGGVAASGSGPQKVSVPATGQGLDGSRSQERAWV